jgi:hypothetical protein
MEFQFTAKAKRFTYILMAIGLLSLVVGFITDHSDHHQRWWSNLLVNGFFYFAIALGALFFYALQYAAEVAWSAQVKRIFEAMYAYLPIGAGVLVVVFLAGTFHLHHIYHWMDESAYSPYVLASTMESEHPSYSMTITDGAVENPGFDSIIHGKRAYLNNGFFWLRTIVYLGTFLFFARFFRKKSLEEDRVGGTQIHKLLYRRGALFLVFFAVFSSTLSWDWLMSIDTHWFSTLYGWYVFSGMWVTTMIFATLFTLWLQSKGYLPNVNKSHIHDLGKWMFAISMLWSYLWFSQFMLIWYANIPEETTYFLNRLNTGYAVPYLAMFFVNFAVPFYMLIARDSKRNPAFLVVAGIVIFIGHFVDVYLLVVPGTMFNHNHFGLFEIGLFLGFFGLFLHTVMNTLSKAPLVPLKHPFLEESEHHQI